MSAFKEYETKPPGELFSLKGKTILVVGGSSGIGLGMAAASGLAGARVVLAARSQEKLESAAAWLEGQKIQVSWLARSITDDGFYEDLDRLIDAEKVRLSGAILSAATYYFQPFLKYERARMEKIVDLNLKAQFLAAQWAGIRMKESGGSLLFVSSGAAVRAMPTNSAYAATKGALRSLTKTLGVELARYKIRVNALIPGWVDTPMTSYAKVSNEKDPSKPSIYDSVKKQIPLGRWGLPRDFAGIGVWLMSDASAYVTGQEFVVDGGLLSA